MLTDCEIVYMVAQGRKEMFSELVVRYQTPVFRLAYSILGNKDDAEDVAQDVFVRAFKSLTAYQESGRFWPWLRRITINVCIKRIRPAEVSIDELGDVAGHYRDSVADAVITAMESARIRRLVLQLPPVYRYVIALKYLEDMSYEEIAEELGETVTNIGVRIHRAKMMLREKMKVISDELQRI